MNGSHFEHTEGDGRETFQVVSKRLNAEYRSGRSKTWIKVKNPKSPAATRAIDGTF